ncbi:HAD family hydrolase [Lacticaseibacillus mingshuiensis]|uniref:HAD family hydrolase n=1 Tax=Lacticaseibacillus mingshuiensis TaxID=2799574 RepID=UPI00195088FE|nr:HAD family hydrolase [Lacticaseibacillus mingshuiensis]
MTGLARIRLITSDLDHTLLTPAGELAGRTVHLIRRLGENGVQFAAISGRDTASMRVLFKPLLKNVWLASHNGAVISKNGAVLAAHPLTEMQVAGLLTLLATHFPAQPVLPVLCREDGIFVVVPSAASEARLRQFFTQLKVVPRFDPFLAGVMKVTCWTNGPAAPVAAQLRQILPAGLQLAVGERDAFSITSAQSDKGQALARIALRLGVPRGATLALGDQGNDLIMLKWAGTGVVMADGDPALIAAIGQVAPPNAKHGADQVLATVLREKMEGTR